MASIMPVPKSARIPGVDGGRKRVLLIAASIIAARGLANWHGIGPATENVIQDAIVKANAIMREIDRMWPSAGR